MMNETWIKTLVKVKKFASVLVVWLIVVSSNKDKQKTTMNKKKS
jgi:hypothetical protein